MAQADQDPPSLPLDLEARALSALDAPAEARAERLAALMAAHPEHAGALASLIAGASEAAPAPKPLGAPRATNAVPDDIGPYHIDGPLGAGGMGDVYLATQTHPVRRQVAMKFVRHARSVAYRQRFELERLALARMEHTCVARVLDAGALADGTPYLVMEYVDGKPLTAFCDEHALDVRARLRLFVEVCRGVQHAHHKGVIHRDLKPANILVTREGDRPVPKLIDFGLARATEGRLGDGSLRTDPGVAIGTPAYMSPEQAGAGGQDVDARTDVFSLGVVLYELLVGRLPFLDEVTPARAELERRIREDDPQRPSTRITTLGAQLAVVARQRGMSPERLRRELRGDLDWIALRAMAKERDARYQTPVELADDLERHLAELPVRAGPPGGWYRVKKFARRHRGAVLGGGLAAVGVLAGLIVSVFFWLAARTEASNAHEVNAFWNDLVVITDPDLEGPRVSLERILTEAVEKLDAGRLAKPALHAQVRAVVGRSFASLGNARLAAPQLDRALELWRDDPTPPLTLATVLRIAGSAHHDLEDLPRAEACWREALDLLRAHAGEDHPETLAARSDLGLLLEKRSDLDGAEQIWRPALAAADGDPAALDVALSIRANLANLLTQRGKPAEAEPVLQDILRLRRKFLDPRHVETLTTLNTLGAALFGLGRFDEAAAAFQECWEGRRDVLDPRADAIFSVGSNLAAALARGGHLAEAAERLEAMIDDATKALGATDGETIRLRNTLGNVLLNLRRADEAVTVLTAALDDADVSARDDPGLLAAIAQNLGQSETALKRFDAAERHLTKALDLRAKLPDPSLRAQTRGSLVRLYEAWGKPDEAAKYR